MEKDIIETTLFNKLKIKEAEIACEKGWRNNLSEEQLLAEVYTALDWV